MSEKSSEVKTGYTMAEIKQEVDNLKWASINEFNKNVASKFAQTVEENAELHLALVEWESMAGKMNALITRYTMPGHYVETIGRNKLRDAMKCGFEAKFKEDKDKIRSQFDAILKKLANMRKPEAALEFLKLCGIDLPEKTKPAISIPVDPEFIKSILPKNKLLTDGSTEGEAV